MLLPGYGWLFPVAGGRINLGAGLLNTFKDFKDVSAQRLFDAFATMLPAEWDIDEEHAEGRVLSGPLPMSMNRAPQAVPGMLLVGDAAGAVNPFNGEGIAYAIETGEIAAELIARGAGEGPARPRDDVPARAARALRRATSRIGRRVRRGRSASPRSWAAPPSTCCRTERSWASRCGVMAQPHRRQGRRRAGQALLRPAAAGAGVVRRRRMPRRADRLPADRRAWRALAVVFAVGSLAASSVPAARTTRTRQALGLRVRQRPGAAAARRAVQREVLRGRDAVHHLRHRDDLPVPVGGDVPPARAVRARRDGGVHRAGVRRLRVRLAQGRARLGGAQVTPVERGTSAERRARTPSPSRRRAGAR